jgi:hypothetical protein
MRHEAISSRAPTFWGIGLVRRHDGRHHQSAQPSAEPLQHQRHDMMIAILDSVELLVKPLKGENDLRELLRRS